MSELIKKQTSAQPLNQGFNHPVQPVVAGRFCPFLFWHWPSSPMEPLKNNMVFINCIKTMKL